MDEVRKGYEQSIVVGAVVVSEGRILLLQRAAGDTFADMWELPSGRRDPFEPVLDTLTREVREETGLEVHVMGILSPFEYRVEKDTVVRDCVQLNYLVVATNPGDLRLSEEHQGSTWIGEADLHNCPVSKETRSVLMEAARRLFSDGR